MGSPALKSETEGTPAAIESNDDGAQDETKSADALDALSKNPDDEGTTPGLAVERKFTLFSKLPVEIRYMIWEEALPGPRVVTSRLFIYSHYLQPQWSLVPSERSPAMLFACQESRKFASSSYQALLYSASCNTQYLDPSKDVLLNLGTKYMDPTAGPKLDAIEFIAERIPKLRKLAHPILWILYGNGEEGNFAGLSRFDSLEELLFPHTFDRVFDIAIIKTYSVNNWADEHSRFAPFISNLSSTLEEIAGKDRKWKVPKLLGGTVVKK